MRKGAKEWYEIAQEDYEVSLYLYKGAHYPQSIYFICQSLEKLLKAARIEISNQPVPKIHDLDKLAQKSGIEFSESRLTKLENLSVHYRRVRYPDIRRIHYNTKRKTETILKRAQNLYLWIQKQLKKY